jgi:hypothetical protein
MWVKQEAWFKTSDVFIPNDLQNCAHHFRIRETRTLFIDIRSQTLSLYSYGDGI